MHEADILTTTTLSADMAEILDFAHSVVTPQSDDYETILEPTNFLGAGIHNLVVRGKNRHTSQPAALKLLRPDLLRGPNAHELRAEFDRATKLTAACRHPNIVQLLGTTAFPVKDQPDLPVQACELLGSSLERLLEKTPRLTADELQALATQLASALDYAHQDQQVVLTDLSLSAVLTRGNQFVLSDLGSVARIDTAGHPVTDYASDDLCGAPEVHGRHREGIVLTSATHSYSLAMLLYYALGGVKEPGFMGSLGHTLNPAGIAEPTFQVLSKATKADPGERFSTATGLVHELIPTL